MKKEQKLTKHHFWILLALSVLLIPVVIGGAAFGVGKAAKDAEAKIKQKVEQLQKASPKGQNYIDALEKQKTYLADRRNHVWKKAYEDQAGLIEWPERLSHLNSLYFGDPIADDDRTRLRDEDVYIAEYRKLDKVIEPTKFVANSWRGALWPIPDPWPKQPTAEDAWLAIEDLAIYREILRDIQAINQFLARCLPIPGSPTVPPDSKDYTQIPEKLKEDLAKYEQAKAAYTKLKDETDKELKEYFKPKSQESVGRFISPYWQIDLAVRPAEGGRAGEHVFRGRITNVSGRRQNIARAEFNVFFQDRAKNPNAQPAKLGVEREYVADGETFEFPDTKSTFTGPRGNLTMYAVDQILTPRFTPVKRVDRIALGQVSHRYATAQLQMAGFSQKEVEAAAAAAPVGVPGSEPGGTPFGGGGPTDGRGGESGGRMAVNYSPCGLQRQRYLHKTEQVRRMPIGVLLIVDQAHVQDVERAFANSRLRFQNTQFHWQRFRGTLGLNDPSILGSGGAFEPNIRDDGPRGGDRFVPPSAIAGPAGRSTGGPPSGGSPPIPPFRPSMPPATPPYGGGVLQNDMGMPIEEGTSNLVELSVYGIASIYERFPPRTPPAGDPGAAVGAPPVPAPAGTGDSPVSPPGDAPPIAPPGNATPTAPVPPVPPTNPTPPGDPK